jgi:4-diphosphocytidyl-2C-methyl-D-erythritol kinase
MVERNIEGLRRSAELRHQQALQQADEGIRRLLQEGRPVNFQTVAEAAHVSTAWLYQHPEIRGRIEHLREQRSAQAHSTPKMKASDASKDAMQAALRQRVKQLETENRELKQQLEVVYGQLYKKQP